MTYVISSYEEMGFAIDNCFAFGRKKSIFYKMPRIKRSEVMQTTLE